MSELVLKLKGKRRYLTTEKHTGSLPSSFFFVGEALLAEVVFVLL